MEKAFDFAFILTRLLSEIITFLYKAMPTRRADG